MFKSVMDNPVNKRIESGCFPVESLIPVRVDDIKKIDFIEKTKEVAEFFRDVPELFGGILLNASQRLKEFEEMNQVIDYQGDMSIIVNTGYFIDDLNINAAYVKEASEYNPVVTDLDKSLWYAAFSFFLYDCLNDKGKDNEQNESSMLMFVHLLRICQEKELDLGITLSIEKVSKPAELYRILSEPWDQLNRKITRKISDTEKEKLRALQKARRELDTAIKDDIKKQWEIAQRTEESWRTFIFVINKISKKEYEVVRRINAVVSANDKISAIYDYDLVIKGIERGRFSLDETEIDWLGTLDNVFERIMVGTPFCRVRTENGAPFVLSPLIIHLAINPKTFNYLFMSFHKLRMKPNKENARSFLELSLKGLNQNLGLPEKENDSIEEIVEDFTNTVRNFANDNKALLDDLKLNHILNDAISPSIEATGLNDFGLWTQYLSDIVGKKKEDSRYEEILEKIVEGKIINIPTITAEQLNDEKRKLEDINQKTIAARIIGSLNIIYMFCDALRIILTNKHANIKIGDKNRVESCQKYLQAIDLRLVIAVYSGIDDYGLLDYREKAGLNYKSISETEIEEERYRNRLFSEIMKNAISQFTESFENQNIDQLFSTKKLIKDEIMRCPNCDEKEQYSEWLDCISEQISDALVRLCKHKADAYSEVRKGIVDDLGKKSNLLDESTIDSLTTAELLYDRYANDEYSSRGFDYSCISALYYQAFEEAYNKLLWEGYAAKLNNLVIGDEKYTDILQNNRKNKRIDLSEATGYLEQDLKTRSCYIEYSSKKNPEARVISRCMYGSFVRLLKNIKSVGGLDKLCDYFAKVFGFDSSQAMFEDEAFMEKFRRFVEKIDLSTTSRNNASHGGTFIGIKQCSEDKKNVLNRLSNVREETLGLIQQLLDIIK